MDGFLYQLQQARSANMDGVVEVVKSFQSQIQKYERRMGKDGEDIRQNLTLFLLELIQKPYMDEKKFPNDITAISYISRGLKHEFFHLCEKTNKYPSYEVELDQEICIADYTDTEQEAIRKSMVESVWQYVTPKEASVLYDIYYRELSIYEVSQKEDVSIQAVNQTKKRALEKIRNHLC